MSTRPIPSWLPAVWAALLALVVLEAIHELSGVGGFDLFDNWVHNVVIVASAALCLGRAFHEPSGRGAWLCFGLALSCWALGDLLWTVLYGADPDAPYPSVADALWLAWYPLSALGVAWLIKTRVSGFELHRWMDGLAVMLTVIIPGFAFVVQPVLEDTDIGVLADVIDFAYPVLDVLLLGAVLGVYGLLAWRPGRTWLLLGAGLALIAASDVAAAVAEARDEAVGDWIVPWTAGAMLIAYAAWRSATPAPETEVYGWRAVALAVAAQVLAGGIQIYGLFAELGPSERVVTLAVLAIATTQIVVTRPRAPGPSA